MSATHKIRLVLIDANGQAHTVSDDVQKYFEDGVKYFNGYGVINPMEDDVEKILEKILMAEKEGK